MMTRKNVPILYRLEGISWLHKKKEVGLKIYLLAEFRNWSSKFIHALLADKIIYQRKFVEKLRNRSGWRNRKNTTIIYNGVDLPDKQVNLKPTTKKMRYVKLKDTIDNSPNSKELIEQSFDQYTSISHKYFEVGKREV